MKTTYKLALISVSICAFGGFAHDTLAQESNVSIYGFINTDIESVRATGANGGVPRLSRLANNLSLLGFRGTEDLGNGLKAFFQIEGNAIVDTGGGSIATRNSGVGLISDYGQIVLGNWELPYKLATAYTLDPFTTNTIAGANSILGNGFVTAGNAVNGAPGNVAASFDKRQNNVIQYWFPKWNGVAGRIAYGISEEKTASSTPSLWSGNVTYENGPLFVSYAHERHNDYFANGTVDRANKVGVGYSFGPTRFRFVYERLEYQPTPSTNLQRDAWQAAVTHQVGNGVVRASYIRALDAKGTASVGVGGIGSPGSDTGATLVALGYGYNISKRTEVYAIYARLQNEARASYNLAVNPVPGLAAGQSPSGIGVGIKHVF